MACFPVITAKVQACNSKCYQLFLCIINYYYAYNVFIWILNPPTNISAQETGRTAITKSASMHLWASVGCLKADPKYNKLWHLLYCY